MILRRGLAIVLFAALFVPEASLSAQTAAAAQDSAVEPQGANNASSTATKEDGGYLLHVNVKLVNVFTNVTDSTGAIVGGLTKEDFFVTEDGRPQRIAVFERQSELPLNLVLAIDTSGSVHKDLPLEQDAARKFVHALLRGQDQISLLEFATDVRQVVPFTNQANRIDRGLASLRGGPATALYDAIYLASENLARQTASGRPGRKVLVLVTDGGDTANTVTYAEALEKALRGEVMVYSIIDVPIEASAGRDTGGEHALITLAEQTGGKYFYANTGGLDKAFAQVSEDLRTQYLLGYYPANQPPGLDFHRIRVSVPRAAQDAFDIRYRTGYYADTQATN
ncbi:VWA domain-containing protein [Acidicapsa acidisoli]|uniref:VWA domain-containing protein n=1 Tax=Acidicapsa acidisoli TaxID=1615681 RepID=UPI0021DFA34A|nr:VWA domain-containing protein [Acidicapsa acidisoli]